ncbi:MAG: class I SAM-dependent methyltransferase, partial [Bacteroidales bacterium]
MEEKKFDPKKLEKLNDPKRLIDLPPWFIKDRLGPVDPKVILDIGAGTGIYSIAFLDFFPQSRIYACDISATMIEWMQENVVPAYPDITPLEMHENKVPLQDQVADLILMVNLHHELEDPALMLAECRRLLREGGRIAICDWKKEEMDSGPPATIRISARQVEKQLEQAGFK